MKLQTKKIGEVCDFYNGLWKGKKPPYTEVGVIRNTNFTKDGELDDSDIAYLPVEKKQLEKRKLVFGDIILEKSGGGPKQPVGRVIIFNKKDGIFSFSNFTSAIRIKDKNEVDYNYLHKFLFFSYISGITESMQSHSTGIRNLDLHTYKEIEISIPPLSEQKRIVKILDEVFNKIEKAKENAEKNLQNSKELFESYLQSVFVNPGKDWEEKTLSEISEIITKGTTPTSIGFKFVDKGINFIKVESLTESGEIVPNKVAHISEECHKSLKRSQLKENDILFSIAGALGRIGIVTKEIVPANTNQALAIIRLKANLLISVRFIARYFNSNFIKNEIKKLKGGVAQQNLSLGQLNKLSVIIPSLLEQKSIVKKLDSLSEQTKKLEEVYKQKLANLEELKKSVLKKAFSGSCK